MEKFLKAVNRPKFKKHFNKADIEELIDLSDVYGELITVKSNVDLGRIKKTTSFSRWHK